MPIKRLIIGITGTPATGKTSFAKELSGDILDSKIIELNDIVEEYKLFSSIDSLGSKIVKLRELTTKVNQLIKEENENITILIVGHLLPDLELDPKITIIMRSSLKELARRQEDRGYPKEKIKENLIAESVDYCGVKSREKWEEVYEVESAEQKEKIAEYIKAKLDGIEPKPPEQEEISKFSELLELITDGNKYGL